MASAPAVPVSSATLPLAIEALVKRFGALTAVAGVSLEVRAGECLGLLGPNGAGKSTVIRAIVGRVIPDSGRISVFGAAADSAQARAALGWVPQELAVYPRLTCKENLVAFGSYHGLSGRQLAESVAWCLEWAALQDRAGDLAGKLSGGMKRRLNMAAGIIQRPRVVLMDEPTVGVDPQSRNRIFEMIEALRDSGHCHRLHHALHGRSGAALRSRCHHRPRQHHCSRHQSRTGSRRIRIAQPGVGTLCRSS
jgi:ABC-2 type transport system ATP-binding protein